MCLILPGTVLELREPLALVETAGVRRWHGFLLHPDLHVGDSVLVHAGQVLEVVGEQTTRDMENAIAELTQLSLKLANLTM